MRAKLKKGVEMVRRWRTMGFLCLLSALFLFLSSSFVSFTADRLRVIRVPDEREGASGERKRREPELGYLLSHQSNASLALSLALLKKKKLQKQPDAVRAVVDAVAAAPDEDLAPLLENFTWTFEKVTQT